MLVNNSIMMDMLPGVMRSALNKEDVSIVSVDTAHLAQNAQVRTICHGNFTIAVITYGNKIFVGEAKRNPHDTPNAKRGERLAISRALKALLLDEE